VTRLNLVRRLPADMCGGLGENRACVERCTRACALVRPSGGDEGAALSVNHAVRVWLRLVL